MKFPKLRSTLTAATPAGEAKLRALDGTEAPYLRARGVGYTARKRGLFSEVITDEEEPAADKGDIMVLQGTYSSGFNDRIVKSVRLSKAGRRGKNYPTPPGGDEAWRAPQLLFMGKGYVAVNVGAGLALPASSIASVVRRGRRGRRGFEWVEGEVALSAFATGWDDDRQSYRWGFSSKMPAVYQYWLSYESPPAPGAVLPSTGSAGNTTTAQSPALFPCMPRVHLYDTVSGFVLTTTPENSGDLRGHLGGKLFVTGPGQLTGLVAVHDRTIQTSAGTMGGFDENDVYVPGAPAVFSTTANRVAPYFLHSTDHGDTWSQIGTGFLSSYIPQTTTPATVDIFTTAVLSTEPLYTAEPLARLAAFSFFVYLGNGKSLFLANNLIVTPPSTLGTMCFLFEGGGFTRLTWGYDTTSALLVAFSDGRLSDGPQFVTDYDSFQRAPANYCFGPGCCALPVWYETGHKLRITRNYGSSWSEVDLPPNLQGVRYFTTTAPYLNEDEPGTILIAKTVTAGAVKQLHCFKTDGNFSTFTDLGPITESVSTATITPWLEALTWAPRSRPLYPQLPDEFNKP